MSEEILKWNHHNRNLLENIYCSYINQEMIDVTLIMRNGEIKAHSLILCAGSRYFQNILTSEVMESRRCVVHGSVSKEIMHYLLEFMYKGQVSVPNGDLKEVLDAAAFYQVRGVSLCQNKLYSRDNMESSCCSSRENLGSQNSSRNPVSLNQNITVPNEINERNETASSSDNLSSPREIDNLSGSSTCSPVINRHRPNMMKNLSKIKINPIAVKTKKITSVERLKKNDWGTKIEDLIPETESSPNRCLKSSKHSKRANLSDEKSNNLHGPRKRRKIIVSDDSEDSDDTRIECSPKPCTSLQATRSEMSQPHSYGEVGCIVEKCNTIVIPNNQTATEMSPDLLEKAQSNNGNVKNVRKKSLIFSSTDEESEVPVVATRPFSVELFRHKAHSETSKEKENSLHASKSSNYEELLLKSPLSAVYHLCALCLEPFDDINLHIKHRHKQRGKNHKQCEFCGKNFSVHSFANPGNHTCKK